MTPQTINTWFPRWLKEWFIPRASNALAIATVSGVVFATDEKTWYTGLARDRFDAILDKTSSPVIFNLLIFLAVTLLVAVILRNFRNKLGTKYLGFERLNSFLGISINTILGLLLVPLVIIISWAFYGNSSESLSLKPHLLTFGFAFVFLGAGFHWLSGEGMNPPQYISYTISPPVNISSDDALTKTQDRLAEVLSHVDLVENPAVLVHAKNNDLTIIIPFKAEFRHWSQSQQRSLFIYLEAIEREWKVDEKWLFLRILPKEIESMAAASATLHFETKRSPE